MRHTIHALLAVFLISIGACGNDSIQPGPGPGGNGTVQGQIGGSDFEFQIDGGDPTVPFGGPFLLRGTNLHYDESGALVVDLSVRNNGAYSHHEPIGLTFVRLDPDGVTVLNPDNDIHDDGAAIVFHFANDDGMWTPGEESLPRTVAFSAQRGTSVAFVARIDIGPTVGGGTIAGRAWNDMNENGMIDEGEPGLPGVGVVLWTFTGEDSMAMREFAATQTDERGFYAFDGLPAGGYVVNEVSPVVHFRPTTPTQIHVLLVVLNNRVSSYLDANFGLVMIDDTPPPYQIGEYVRAYGKYQRDDVFASRVVEHVDCEPDTMPIPLLKDVRLACPPSRLRGPVTEIAPLRNAFRVMATWVVIDAVTIPENIQVGSRVDVTVHPGVGPIGWIADMIVAWDQPQDEIHGIIQAIEQGANEPLRIRVLDTWIVPGNVTVTP